eukprot:GSChrysophyteH1.ASY1.ANO1.1275.1 assembled CDS
MAATLMRLGKSCPLKTTSSLLLRRQFAPSIQYVGSLRRYSDPGLLHVGGFQRRHFSEASETLEFRAETRKILDIVTNSIYTDKEVFLRELISNASDALENEINILTDETNGTLTIIDNGVGMSRQEFIDNLGTIAASGKSDGIIGQFGVGFYSAFMVSSEVSVESISAAVDPGADSASASPTGGHIWTSDGTGQFTIAETSHDTLDGNTAHGCKIVMKLKEDCKEFSNPERIKEIIQKYSNFVSFPIKINGEEVNTFGGGRIEPGVNLYSRKVLIENKPSDLLPDWCRFIKGVVDSEDLPLSLSREKPQDTRLLARIRDKDFEKYKEFYIEYNFFLKEGNFGGRPLVSAETSSVDLNTERESNAPLNDGDSKQLCDWLASTLGPSLVREVKVTTRLSDSPACITDHESGAMRRMMKMVDQSNAGMSTQLPPQILEVNTNHPIIKSLYKLSSDQAGNNELYSKIVAEQVYDNALIAAGLIDDPRAMLPRINKILEESLSSK